MLIVLQNFSTSLRQMILHSISILVGKIDNVLFPPVYLFLSLIRFSVSDCLLMGQKIRSSIYIFKLDCLIVLACLIIWQSEHCNSDYFFCKLNEGRKCYYTLAIFVGNCYNCLYVICLAYKFSFLFFFFFFFLLFPCLFFYINHYRCKFRTNLSFSTL